MNAMSKIRDARTSVQPAIGLAGSATLRTPCGGRRAENIRKGDLIVTRDAGLQPVRMVWSRTVTAAQISADPSLAPVRLKPRAIGPMMPQRDLVLAGAHRVLVPGYRLAEMPDTTACLLAARDVAEASDAAYVDKALTEITYYNIVFDAHQVFCANGLPVESFLPSKTVLGQLDRSVREDLIALFPELDGQDAEFPAADYPSPDPASYRPEFV